MNKCDLIVIGGSAGSLEVLLHTFSFLQDNIPAPIIIVLHRKSSYDSTLADLFAARTNLTVKEAEEKEHIQSNTIYIAPADYHLLIEKDHSFSLDFSEKVNYSRPSIDVTFESAAEVYSNTLVCILLSGANADGVDGLKAVKDRGGIIVAQDPNTAEVPYMPQQAIQHLPIDFIVAGEEVATFINNLNK